MGIKVSELAQELAQGLSEYSQEVADASKKQPTKWPKKPFKS